MKSLLRILFLLFIAPIIYAQHNPNSWLIGVNTTSHFSEVSEIGGSIHLDYAPNCFSSYIAEIGAIRYKNEIIPEFNISINSILNNFNNRFYLIGGIGLAVNGAKLSKEEQKDALFTFSNRTTNLGALIKIRGLLPINDWWFFSSEINLKSIGSEFSTFTLGLLYELPKK